MTLKKVISLLSIFSLIFIGCKKTTQSEQSEIINDSIKKPEQNNLKVVEKDLTIYNSGSNFGEIAITGKATRLYFIKNTAKSGISFKSIKLSNNSFSFKDGFPGYKDIGSKKFPNLCSENGTLQINESCRFAVTFTPNSEKEEFVNLTFKYFIDNNQKMFNYPLSGKGRKLSEGAIKFLQLESYFVQVPTSLLNNLEKDKFNKDDTLIQSVFAEGHSKKFYLDDYFKTQANQPSEVWKKHLSISRVIGYTFRSDGRAPKVPGNKCDDNWKNGFTLTQESTGKVVFYPPHKDYLGNIEDCGVQDVGGFWPAVTRPSDMIYIDKMLVKYKKKYGKDFDYKTQPLSDLPEADYNKYVTGNKHNVIPPDAISLTNHLNWYLQNVLNASAHTHSNFDFKGFISTTRQLDSILKVPDLNTKEKWIYVTYVEGGFLMPKPWNLKFKNSAFSFAKTALSEVTVPGGIPWEDVIAYTQLDASVPIYFRKNFDKVDPKAYDIILKKLSSAKKP